MRRSVNFTGILCAHTHKRSTSRHPQSQEDSRVRTTMLLMVLVLLQVPVEASEHVRCFATFDLISGECAQELGQVEKDDCCQNPHYGYQATDGVCRFCGSPVWSPWSSWSPCTVLCGEGVTQRRRSCFGIGELECEDAKNLLQTKPCNSTCCDDTGWSSWHSWSPCSLSCGGRGVRSRNRVCSSAPECHAACEGSSEQAEPCNATSPCPVHGAWSSWSIWSQCSASCINDQRNNVIVPTRMQHRTCSNPTPSSDTVPPGNGCPGDSAEAQQCSELPNCPVDGNWGEWSEPGSCSVSCGEGLRLASRMCDNPAPKYGGRLCEGPSTRHFVCQSPCPVHGFWSGWSSWSDCSSSCITEGHATVRTRRRYCSNPAPSPSPPGKDCVGDSLQTESCDHLSYCPVHGSWGQWSPFSYCSVTCGLGLQLSNRKCDSPAPKHGGQSCPGPASQSRICVTNIHCPVDGVWSEWSSWKQCEYPISGKEIRCKHLGGSQSRERQCLYQAYNGSICSGNKLTDRRVCYDINQCYMKGSWAGWEAWSLCSPPCGGKSRRMRQRICQPDVSAYRPTIGRLNEKATFFGTPLSDCGRVSLKEKWEVQTCHNVPSCT
ncbi:properdin-like [Thalassophryne amazonica]|uniref:properdin-like n=1 Tax=Thalassophryne amazonica TaxID=390379 RepID=UPI0014718112|nr:properdin-like [Thalassophryne amazonica]